MDQEKLHTKSAMEEEEHEERDEEKIDKFFAIIRRLRDDRRGSVSSLRQLEVQRATSKKGKKIHGYVPPPPPCFELGSSKSPPCATEQESSSDREFVGEEEKGINLDLTL
ncbi:hypothetical protein LINPERHAP1_LOCUS16624 [Linum perenne]